MPGLFGTRAEILPDLNLLLQIIILIILFVAVRVVRPRTQVSLQRHGRFMTIAVVLNAISILLVMGPSLAKNFDYALAEPSTIGFPLTLIHHSLGIIAEILGAVLIFKKFGNVRMWMRLTFILWLISWVLGIYFYLFYYVL